MSQQPTDLHGIPHRPIAIPLFSAIAVVATLAVATIFAPALLAQLGIELSDEIPNPRLASYGQRIGVEEQLYGNKGTRGFDDSQIDVARPPNLLPETIENPGTEQLSNGSASVPDELISRLAQIEGEMGSWRSKAESQAAAIESLESLNREQSVTVARLTDETSRLSTQLVQSDEVRRQHGAELARLEAEGWLSCKTEPSGRKTCAPMMPQREVQTVYRVELPQQCEPVVTIHPYCWN
jgi:hypothetical protein